LLSAELVTAADEQQDPALAEREHLEGEQKEVQQAQRRQVLRLEEHDDPDHPVIKLATQRIEELSGRAEAIERALEGLAQPSQKAGPTAQEIEAMLAEVPDLREALDKADDTELIELFDAFDVALTSTSARGNWS
jgi:hypothetical protein